MPTLTHQTGPFAIVPRWIIRHPSLKPSAVLVYAYLADRANRDLGNLAWPGQRLIAEELHMSTKTVNLSITELEDAGALTVKRDHRKVNQYTVNVVEPTTPPNFLVVETTTKTVRESTTQQEPLEQEPLETATRSRPRSEKQHANDLLIEAFHNACGYRPPISRAMMRKTAVALAELRPIIPTVEEIHERARIYRATRPGTLTPHALVAWWAACAPPSVNGSCPNKCGPDGFYWPSENARTAAPCLNPGCETKRKARR